MDLPATADSIRVLYIEDDERLGALTRTYLERHGLDVHLETRGDAALAVAREFDPHVVLLDVMLPGMTGHEVCARLRTLVDVPILMVSALDEEADRVMGLEGGADDYVTKPFSSRELLARLRAHVRRAQRPKSDGEVVRIADLHIDRGARRVTRAGEVVALTSTEFDLLWALASPAGRVRSRDALMRSVHDSDEAVFDRAIDVLVSRVRAKLGDDPKAPRWIKTVRGAGYMLADGR
ncbi:MAG: response regulator transcription factor [Myxococcales bacterium]|nr:response regulator transcription factor [Myxococcales bacterium]MCB9521155.1 response regulator transcription factor [Myxococcales bacterium]MCB9530181.1 response regulator transcription factor [Myxococcales bacterium]